MKSRLRFSMLIMCTILLTYSNGTFAENEDLIPQQTKIVTNSIEGDEVKESDTQKAINTNVLLKDRMSIKTVEDKKDEFEYIDLGEFRISHYCNCSICCGKWAGGTCKNGNMPIDNYTIAIDESVIQMNSFVQIDGKTYKAMDTGSAIIGNKIDLYISNHEKARQLGVKYEHVYLIRRK